MASIFQRIKAAIESRGQRDRASVQNYFKPVSGQTRTRDTVREFFKPSSLRQLPRDVGTAARTAAQRPDILARGAYSGGVAPVLKLAARYAPAYGQRNKELKERTQGFIDRTVQAPQGLDENQQALFQGSQFAGAVAPYSAVESGLAKGLNAIPRVSRLAGRSNLAGAATRFGVRRAADIGSGQILAEPGTSGKDRLKQAGLDFLLGSSADFVGAGAKGVTKKARYNQNIGKLNAEVPNTKTTSKIGGKSVNEVFNPQRIKVKNNEAEFFLKEGRLPGKNDVVPQDYRFKGNTELVLDDKGNLISWKTDNDKFSTKILQDKTQPGLSTLDVSEYQNAKPKESFINDYVKEQKNLQNTARTSVKPSLISRGKDFLKTVKTKFQDSATPIEDLLAESQKKGKFELLPSKDIRHNIDRVLRSSSLAGQFVKDTGLEDVIKNVPDLDVLNQYLIAKQATRVSERGIETGRDLLKDKKFIDAAAPQYEQFGQQVVEHSRKLLDYLTESGVIAKETADTLKKTYPDYVPLNRIFDAKELDNMAKGVGGGGPASVSGQNLIKKLKGSERAIEDPVDSILTKTVEAFRVGERNKAAQTLVSYKDLPNNPFALKKVTGDVPPGSSTVSVLENGKKVTYETLPEIADAAKNLKEEHLNQILRIISIPKRILQAGATSLNLPFIASNIAKDQMFSFVNSKRAFATANPINFFKSAMSVLKQDELYDEWVRSAGSLTRMDVGRNQVKPTVNRIRADKNIASKIAYTVKNPEELLRAVEDIIGKGEEVTRVQQFAGTKGALLKEGRTATDASLLAARASRENTANFARRGDFGTVINSMIPFFNASIQGARSLRTSLKENPIKTGAKLGITAFAPVLYASFWNQSDPQRKEVYDDIPEYEKENNFIVIPPNPSQDEKGRWNVIKIPIPPGVSNLANIVRTQAEGLNGFNQETFDRIAGDLFTAGTSLNPLDTDQLLSSLVPQGLKPGLETYTGKNLFTGLDTVPRSLQDLPEEQQVRPYTSGTARLLSKYLGGNKVANLAGISKSPLKTENALGTAGAGLGDTLLNLSDRALAAAGVIPEEQIGGRGVGEQVLTRFAKARGGENQNRQFEELQSLNQQSKSESNQKKEFARQIYQQIKDLPQEQRIEELKRLEQQGQLDKKTFDYYKDFKKDDEAQVSSYEKALRNAPVSTRGQIIFNEIKDLPKEGRIARLEELNAKGILTKSVYEKYLEIKNQSGIE